MTTPIITDLSPCFEPERYDPMLADDLWINNVSGAPARRAGMTLNEVEAARQGVPPTAADPNADYTELVGCPVTYVNGTGTIDPMTPEIVSTNHPIVALQTRPWQTPIGVIHADPSGTPSRVQIMRRGTFAITWSHFRPSNPAFLTDPQQILGNRVQFYIYDEENDETRWFYATAPLMQPRDNLGYEAQLVGAYGGSSVGYISKITTDTADPMIYITIDPHPAISKYVVCPFMASQADIEIGSVVCIDTETMRMRPWRSWYANDEPSNWRTTAIGVCAGKIHENGEIYWYVCVSGPAYMRAKSEKLYRRVDSSEQSLFHHPCGIPIDCDGALVYGTNAQNERDWQDIPIIGTICDHGWPAIDTHHVPPRDVFLLIDVNPCIGMGAQPEIQLRDMPFDYREGW